MIEDIDDDIESFKDKQRKLVEFRANIVLNALIEDPHPDSLGYFTYAIESLQWYNPPVMADETFSDLLATGNSVLLGPNLRRVLAKYYNSIEYYRQREKLFGEILTRGYRRIPSHVLGRRHAEVFKKIQLRRSQQIPDYPIDVNISNGELRKILDRLRSIDNLESLIAERLYIESQHNENYGDRLFRLATALRKILIAVKNDEIMDKDIAFTEADLKN